MQNYWHLELWDKEVIKVRPDADKIKFIQAILAKGEGMITTPTRSINVKDVKGFQVSDEVYTDQKMIEGIAKAFNEPILTEYGVKSKWVKKSVPRRRWDSHYRFIPAYKMLVENDSYVVIAFKVPVHQINPLNVEELSPREILSLNTT